MANHTKLVLGLILSFLTSSLFSTERQPWIGNYLEFEWRTSLLYQTFRQVAIGSELVRYSRDDRFVNLSLSNAIKPEFSLELEAVLANTRQQNRFVDHLKLTGRYVLLDDIAGDLVTVTLGAAFIKAFRSALSDIGSFHHGLEEAELFLSVGKEISYGTTWKSRSWLMIGIGAANEGRPWLHGIAAYEHRFAKLQTLRLFLEGLWGQGHQCLNPWHFDGYGNIRHKSVDLGFRYTYEIPYSGEISLQYAWRCYARNFPAHAHRIMLTVLYTFGL